MQMYLIIRKTVMYQALTMTATGMSRHLTILWFFRPLFSLFRQFHSSQRAWLVLWRGNGYVKQMVVGLVSLFFVGSSSDSQYLMGEQYLEGAPILVTSHRLLPTGKTQEN